jgi:hypothetical protein
MKTVPVMPVVVIAVVVIVVIVTRLYFKSVVLSYRTAILLPPKRWKG